MLPMFPDGFWLSGEFGHEFSTSFEHWPLSSPALQYSLILVQPDRQRLRHRRDSLAALPGPLSHVARRVLRSNLHPLHCDI